MVVLPAPLGAEMMMHLPIVTDHSYHWDLQYHPIRLLLSPCLLHETCSVGPALGSSFPTLYAFGVATDLPDRPVKKRPRIFGRYRMSKGH